MFKEIEDEVWIEKLDNGDELIHRSFSLSAICEMELPFSHEEFPDLFETITRTIKEWVCQIKATPKHKFNIEEYKRCNRPAVMAVRDYLIKLGRNVIVEPYGKYDIDLKSIDENGVVTYFEPELAKQWYPSNFNFPNSWNIHVLSRKWHYVDYPKSCLVTVRNDCKRMYMTPFSFLTDEFIYERKAFIKNSHNPEGEWMVNIYWKNESKPYNLN